jgi:ubiquinone/menaquinone biosynthesis C-methylase UbiE
MPTEPCYVPAAGRAALAPLYDRVMALTMRESRWRPALTASVLAGVHDGDIVVDVGCGTSRSSSARPDSLRSR